MAFSGADLAENMLQQVLGTARSIPDSLGGE